jgi:spermidine synthase
MHGSTIHGAQKLLDEGKPITGRPEPITYYHPSSGLAQAVDGVRARKSTPMRVAVIGLGSGTLACLNQPGESWRFFEIDRSIVHIARDSGLFTYLPSCAPDVPIVLGDARLTLAKEPDGAFDLIIVDAYSSDAIPIHLATKEAMAVYKAKLASDGVVVMHISNRHLELASVVTGIAAANDLKTWVYDRTTEDDGVDDYYVFSTEVTLSARQEADIGGLRDKAAWQLTPPDPKVRTWTDDYSNIVGSILRKWR